MSVSTGDQKIPFKAVGIGVLLSAAVIALLLCVFALVLNMMSAIPYGIIDYVTVAIQGAGVLIGAYIASAIAKSRGLIVGLLCAGVVLLCTLAIGLSRQQESVTALTAIRAAVLLLCGAAGGIRGVNRKEKIRIR